MKILCVADTVDPLVDSVSIKKRFGDVDLVLGAGDLPMEYLSFIASALDRPVLFVFGNHNLGDLPFYRQGAVSSPFPAFDFQRDSGATYIGFRMHREAGLIVMGLGGSLRYNDGRNQFTQTQMWLRVLARLPALLFNRLFRGRAVDVVLTHAPPRGIHDREDRCHQGFDAFLWLMRVFTPRYLVHGHVHLYDARENRLTTYGETVVCNAYGHFLIDTGDGHAR
ncbi:MAG: metallophosphoesterase [Spirochaetae bacterium HGW-Spirochaetae-7]|jgi:Icc-related predicted phosphoesterase|nr:MAG: metallophosphoesterase [Spirochaetae bacterium HGW-Spirochaetae-7]